MGCPIIYQFSEVHQSLEKAPLSLPFDYKYQTNLLLKTSEGSFYTWRMLLVAVVVVPEVLPITTGSQSLFIFETSKLVLFVLKQTKRSVKIVILSRKVEVKISSFLIFRISSIQWRENRSGNHKKEVYHRKIEIFEQ